MMTPVCRVIFAKRSAMSDQKRLRSLELSGQRGQALAEAVVVLSIATVLLAAMATGSRLQMQWHEDLVDAHLSALSVARGHFDGATPGSASGGGPRWLKAGWDIARRIGGALISSSSSRTSRPGQSSATKDALRKAATAAVRSAGAHALAGGFDAVSEMGSSRTQERASGRQISRAITSVGRHVLQGYGKSRRRQLVTDDPLSSVTLFDTQADSMRPENPHLADILGGSLQWVRVRTGSPFRNHAWQIRGHGLISDTHENVDRIDRSHALWQQAANSSRQVVRRIAPMTEQVDLPWFRAAPPTDWLSRWSDVTGADSQTGWGALGTRVKQWVGGLF